MEPCQEIAENIVKNVGRVIIGKSDVVRRILACWFAGGHALLEDVPGTGKTMMARALAKSVQLDFKRVQFTPDLLPADIVGSSIFNSAQHTFQFSPGPVFTTIFLGDEINRATPRTQSALLEAMAEGQVSVDGKTYALPAPFFVIATQNPIEQQGTFPLPEAQLDRFMMKLSMGYPKRNEEVEMLKSQTKAHPIQALTPVESEERLLFVRQRVSQITVSDEVYDYVLRLVERTRSCQELKIGVSPRATQSLVRVSQALALIQGKGYVSPSHIQELAPLVWCHRLVPTPEARLNGLKPSAIISAILKETKVPVESLQRKAS